LFINDLSAGELPKAFDPVFQVSRYGERLAARDTQLDNLYRHPKGEPSLAPKFLETISRTILKKRNPSVVAVNRVPLRPVNMLGALRCHKACKPLIAMTSRNRHGAGGFL